LPLGMGELGRVRQLSRASATTRMQTIPHITSRLSEVGSESRLWR
jgi:hypothetical protein